MISIMHAHWLSSPISSHDGASSRPLRRMTVSYILGLGMLGVLTLASYLLLRAQIDEGEASAALVNVSGRQRMLLKQTSLLSLQLLASAGHRVFVHGCDGHTAGRLYTEQAMHSLGLPVADSWREVEQQLDKHRLSYLPIRHFCAPLHQLMQLRPLLGLRSPVNTLTRMLNPLRAPASVQSIFHPAYGSLHQTADALLGQERALVFKGDSGEAEVKPQADTRLQLLSGGARTELTLPRTMAGKVAPVEEPSVDPLRMLWRGEVEDEYGLAAVLATAAVALFTLGTAANLDDAREQAMRAWQARDPGSLN